MTTETPNQPTGIDARFAAGVRNGAKGASETDRTTDSAEGGAAGGASSATDGNAAGQTTAVAAGSSCSIKPHRPYRDANGQIHLTRLTEKGG